MARPRDVLAKLEEVKEFEEFEDFEDFTEEAAVTRNQQFRGGRSGKSPKLTPEQKIAFDQQQAKDDAAEATRQRWDTLPGVPSKAVLEVDLSQPLDSPNQSDNLFGNFMWDMRPTHDVRRPVTTAAISPVLLLPTKCVCGRSLATLVPKLGRMMESDPNQRLSAADLNACDLKTCCRGLVLGSQGNILDVLTSHVVPLFN
jgi:hypothetical protein